MKVGKSEKPMVQILYDRFCAEISRDEEHIPKSLGESFEFV